MAYKKYIKKNRKQGRNINRVFYKKFVLFLFGIFLIIALIYTILFFNEKISGKAVLNLETIYQEEQPLEGALKLFLKEGELVPADSKIIFENSGNEYEYLLSELVSDETAEGNFYVEGKSITGSGLGYGVKGKKEVYPVVDFELNIYSSKEAEKSEKKAEDAEQEKEKKEEGDSELFTSEDSTESSGAEEETEEQGEISDEVEEVESVEEETEEQETGAEQVQVSSENIGQESSLNAGESLSEEEVESSEETETEEAGEGETEEADEAPAETPITGNAISNFFNMFSNFFLSLTGQVSMEFETTMSGEVSADKAFVYDLGEGQTAEIVSSTQDVDMKIKNNQVIITTDYSVKEDGFGKDYLKDKGKELVIDLSKLNLIFEEEELNIKLVYESNEIVSMSTLLIEGDKEIKKIDKNVTNKSKPFADKGFLELNEKDKEILYDKFGNASLKTTKAEVVNGRLVVRYELGSYWRENSYDYFGEVDEILEIQMKEDRIKLIKDLVDKFSEEEASSQIIGELVKDYKI